MKLIRHIAFLLNFGLLVSAWNAFAANDAAVADIEKLGGFVSKVFQASGELEVDFHLRGQSLTDEGLAKVAKLENVVTLHLGGTQVTGEGLAHLKDFSNLRRLHLERTQVDDAGLAHLKNLASLEYLNLYDTTVTDEGLRHLQGLKKLRRLYLWQTKTSEAGTTALSKELPALLVDTGADLSVLTLSEPPKKLGILKWIPASTVTPPKSRNGANHQITFENHSKKRIRLVWISYGGEKKVYGEIAPGSKRQQNTYSNNTWLICDMEDRPYGHFIVGGESARAIIPANL